MNDPEVRELRYFLAVAEELHFGRAATRLGMAQPPLSRAIRILERRLGVPLFERTTRQVTLTPAGGVLLREARIVLDAVTAATRRAQHAGRTASVLRVAVKAEYDAGLLPRILDTFRREDAALPVDLVLGGRGEQVIALRDGRADVALVLGEIHDPALDTEPLLVEQRFVALAADDPLAARSSLSLADLAGRVLPDGSPAETDGRRPSDADVHLVPAAATGPARKEVTNAERGPLDLAQIFSLIEVGSIVWFPPASLARRHPRDGIAYRAVSDLASETLRVAWPRHSHSPTVAAFARVAVDTAAASADTGVGAVHDAPPVLGVASDLQYSSRRLV